MKTFLVIALGWVFLWLPGSAQANRVGNGGDGVIVGDHIYLLDLHEAGVEENPFFQKDTKADSLEVGQFVSEIPFLSSEAAAYISRKLSEIEKKDIKTSWALKSAIGRYTWILTNDKLRDIPDEETNLDIPADHLVQLAVRTGKRIQVSKESWTRLEPSHQAALVIHEMVYALIALERDGLGFRQSSTKTRELVGYFFQPQFQLDSRGAFLEVVANLLPLVNTREELVKIDSKTIWSSDSWYMFLPHGLCLGGGKVQKAGENHPYSSTSSGHSAQVYATQICECAKQAGDRALADLMMAATPFSLQFQSFQDSGGRVREALAVMPDDNQHLFTHKFTRQSFDSQYAKTCLNNAKSLFDKAWDEATTMLDFVGYKID